MTSQQYSIGIDPGKTDWGTVLNNGEVVASGEVVLDSARLAIGRKIFNFSDDCSQIIVAIEVPDIKRGVFSRGKEDRSVRSRQAMVMRTLARAMRLIGNLERHGFKVYPVKAKETRATITGWHEQMKRIDELTYQYVPYKFDRYWKDQLNGQGIRTGTGTLLNTVHVRDAYVYALWGLRVALNQPHEVEKYLVVIT